MNNYPLKNGRSLNKRDSKMNYKKIIIAAWGIMILLSYLFKIDSTPPLPLPVLIRIGWAILIISTIVTLIIKIKWGNMKHKGIMIVAWLFLIVWDKTGPVTTMGPIRPTSLIIYFWVLVACTTFIIVRYIIKKRKIMKKDNSRQGNWCGTPQLEMEIARRIEEFGGSLAINSTDIENRLVTFLKGKTEEEWLALENLFLISPFVLYLAEIPNENRVKVLEDRGYIVYNGVGNTRLKDAVHNLMKEDVISLNDYLQLLSNFYKLLDNERFGKLVETIGANNKKK